MDNKQLYQVVLGLKLLWYVSQIAVKKRRRSGLIVPPTATFCCPECGGKRVRSTTVRQSDADGI